MALPYEIKKYERTPEQLAPPELLRINPLGKSPIITDGDVTLAESGAIVGMDSTSIASGNSLTNKHTLFIIEYLITKYGNGKGVAPDSGYLDNLYCKSTILLFFVTLMPIFYLISQSPILH